MLAFSDDTSAGAQGASVHTDATSRGNIAERRAFGARLKAERERRDIALSSIADATKVKASLLEELERGDISRWPLGIYRRSFFRDYVMAIGLPVDAITREFAALFIEPPASV